MQSLPTAFIRISAPEKRFKRKYPYVAEKYDAQRQYLLKKNKTEYVESIVDEFFKLPKRLFKSHNDKIQKWKK